MPPWLESLPSPPQAFLLPSSSSMSLICLSPQSMPLENLSFLSAGTTLILVYVAPALGIKGSWGWMDSRKHRWLWGTKGSDRPQRRDAVLASTAQSKPVSSLDSLV